VDFVRWVVVLAAPAFLRFIFIILGSRTYSGIFSGIFRTLKTSISNLWPTTSGIDTLASLVMLLTKFSPLSALMAFSGVHQHC
jgi:hypothetical protein